jgi:acyl-ACP thioesterase
MTGTKTIPDIYTRPFAIDWNSTAPSGKLSITGLLNLIQLTAGEHATLCGFGFYDMRREGQAWVLTRMKMRFTSMPRWNEEIEISTWIENMTGSISVRNLSFSHHGETFAQISTVWVCLSLEKHTPETIKAPCPDFLIHPEKTLEISTAGRVKIPTQPATLREYKVSFSDIDAMGHVNNIKYTQWILDSIPYKDAVSITSGEIEVNFLSELHIDDVVEIKYGNTSDDGEATFIIQKKGEEKPAFLSHYTPIR